jgi:hypothetical protein
MVGVGKTTELFRVCHMFDNPRDLHLLSHVSAHCSGLIAEESASMTCFVRVDLLVMFHNMRNSFLLTDCYQSDYVWDKSTLDSGPDIFNQFVYYTDVSVSSDILTPMTHVFQDY